MEDSPWTFTQPLRNGVIFRYVGTLQSRVKLPSSMMTDTRHETLLLRLGSRLMEQDKMLVTAESCTGGGIAYAITEIPGSSEWFERGIRHLFQPGQAGATGR